MSACVVASGCSSEPDSCLDQAPPSWRADGWIDEHGALADGVTSNFRVLTINVGNGTLDAGPYSLRLADQGYEDVIAAKIQTLAPDLLGIQEVAPRKQCTTAAACPVHADADGVCLPEAGYVCEPLTCTGVDDRPDQVERLLGPDYTILCAGLNEGGISSVDCVGVHERFGRVVDYHDGSLVAAGTYLPEWGADAPGQWSYWRAEGFTACDFTKNECTFEGTACDSESSIMWADVAVAPDFVEIVRVVHLHPTAIGERCREHQLARAFEAAAERWDLPGPRRTLMLGDWNFDPERLVLPVEEALYYAYVGPNRPLHEHDERDHDEDCARVKTGPEIAGNRVAAIDRVVSDFAIGYCQAFSDERSAMHGTALGRFDSGVTPEGLPETTDCACCYAGDVRATAMDHLAVVCDLVWPDAPG